MNRTQLNRFLAGKTLHTCNHFERKFFDLGLLRYGHLLLVHDGTKPMDALPDVYERVGDRLTLVEWWK